MLARSGLRRDGRFAPLGRIFLESHQARALAEGFGRLPPWLAAPHDAYSQLLLSRQRVVADPGPASRDEGYVLPPEAMQIAL